MQRTINYPVTSPLTQETAMQQESTHFQFPGPQKRDRTSTHLGIDLATPAGDHRRKGHGHDCYPLLAQRTMVRAVPEAVRQRRGSQLRRLPGQRRQLET